METSSASLGLWVGNSPVNSPHKWPVTRKMFPFDDVIMWNENVGISIKISLKFIPKDPINNIPALAQIVAWRRPGVKPLSEPMMVSLPTRICVTQPQWVNIGWHSSLMLKCLTKPRWVQFLRSKTSGYIYTCPWYFQKHFLLTEKRQTRALHGHKSVGNICSFMS